MDLYDIVLAADAQIPMRAERIKYYEVRLLKRIFDQQIGNLPYLSTAKIAE